MAANFNDPTYLRERQYRDASNLDARIALHRRFSTNPQPFARWLFQQISFPPRARVLEVGCGPATLWRDNLDATPKTLDVTLSDFSPGMVDAARAALGTQAPRFHFAVADVQSLPYADGAFDVVIANHMLYHVPDVSRAIAELNRVLRAGGVLYAATNGEHHLRGLHEMADQVDPVLSEAWRSVRDGAAGFSLESGRALLERMFAVVNLRRFENELVVTEAEPIVRYFQSGHAPLSDNTADRLRALAEDQIDRFGAVRIHPDVGVFQAITH